MKKKKRALTKQQREAILRSLDRSPQSLPQTADKNILQNKPETNGTSPNSAITEIKRILLVLLVVVVVLGALIIVDKKTTYLSRFGSLIAAKLKISN